MNQNQFLISPGFRHNGQTDYSWAHYGNDFNKINRTITLLQSFNDLNNNRYPVLIDSSYGASHHCGLNSFLQAVFYRSDRIIPFLKGCLNKLQNNTQLSSLEDAVLEWYLVFTDINAPETAMSIATNRLLDQLGQYQWNKNLMINNINHNINCSVFKQQGNRECGAYYLPNSLRNKKIDAKFARNSYYVNTYENQNANPILGHNDRIDLIEARQDGNNTYGLFEPKNLNTFFIEQSLNNNDNLRNISFDNVTVFNNPTLKTNHDQFCTYDIGNGTFINWAGNLSLLSSQQRKTNRFSAPNHYTFETPKLVYRNVKNTAPYDNNDPRYYVFMGLKNNLLLCSDSLKTRYEYIRKLNNNNSPPKVNNKKKVKKKKFYKYKSYNYNYRNIDNNFFYPKKNTQQPIINNNVNNSDINDVKDDKISYFKERTSSSIGEKIIAIVIILLTILGGLFIINNKKPFLNLNSNSNDANVQK